MISSKYEITDSVQRRAPTGNIARGLLGRRFDQILPHQLVICRELAQSIRPKVKVRPVPALSPMCGVALRFRHIHISSEIEEKRSELGRVVFRVVDRKRGSFGVVREPVVVDDDVCAIGGKPFGDGCTDGARRACDQGYFTCERPAGVRRRWVRRVHG